MRETGVEPVRLASTELESVSLTTRTLTLSAVYDDELIFWFFCVFFRQRQTASGVLAPLLGDEGVLTIRSAHCLHLGGCLRLSQLGVCAHFQGVVRV